MKGIILAGGAGTRLNPITRGISKQLVPVYDKPMIYYPLSVLMRAGIRDILMITTERDQPLFKYTLGDGKDFGLNLSYIIQPSPNGLAEAFILGEEFIEDKECAMILGDNIYHGEEGLDKFLNSAKEEAKNGKATIFGYKVNDPQRFGIMELDENNNVVSVEEKPKNPKSDYAITGLYFYPKGVSEKAKQVVPSDRGELEITSLNDMYLKEGNLRAELLGDEYTWFDTGTFDSLLAASNMISALEKNRGRLISSPEAIAYEKGWLDEEQLLETSESMNKNFYGQTLAKSKKLLLSNNK